MALTFGLIGAGLGILNSLLGSVSQANAQRAQAAQLERNAEVMRANARLEQERGRVEAEAIDAKKSDLRRKFMEGQARNRSLLAAGNVDMTSGSALDVSLGNIELFANDVAENSYAKVVRQWEADQQAKNLRYQADAALAQASYLNQSAGNIGTSLLSAALGGASGFASGYSLAGGKLTKLFGGKG